ncbi:MAG: RICIN domain-containing protein, partial [Ferruginibacter sp.]|nr:RICIN domain-containing protein [Cytophagales bacterium]
MGSTVGTYYQTALNEGILRAEENVGSFRAQMVNSLCGKILRIDPNTGDGVASNPFYNPSQPRASQSRVWALGFRNPFRMTLQPNTGQSAAANGDPGTLLVGDVGWNTWEDLHIVHQAGLNCGWPLYEGLEAGSYYGTNVRNPDEPGRPTFESLCQPPTFATDDPNPANRRLRHARPALSWEHRNPVARIPSFNGGVPTTLALGMAGAPTGTSFKGNASVGGAYYSGNQFPTSYRNTYFFADYGANWIKNAVLRYEGDRWVQEVRDFAPAGFAQGIVDLEYNPLNGSLFCVNINSGEVMQISHGGNQAPVAKAAADVTSGTSPLRVQFSSAGSTDPEGGALTYEWTFGDGTASTEANPVHTFSAAGPKGFTVTQTVKDNGNLADSRTLVISVNSTAPSVRITAPADGALYPLDRESEYALRASATDRGGARLRYEWQVTLRHNNHAHREPVITEAAPTVLLSPVGCDGETYHYLITCRVTNEGGLVAVDSVKLYPNCASGSIAVRNVNAVPQADAVRVSWENPAASFEEVLVVAKENQGFQDKPVGTAYTANADFNGNGTGIEGGKVVYRGTGTGVTVTNLGVAKTYFFRVYARVGDAWNGGVEVNATPLFQPGKCYQLTVRHSGKSLTASPTGNAVQNDFKGAAGQLWRLVEVEAGYYQILATHNGKALEVADGALERGAAVRLGEYTGGNHQKWKLVKNTEGYYQL